MTSEIIIGTSLEIRGVVLGGGRGTRLHPLTAETSKHLLPLGNKPMIVRVIEQLLAAEVKDVLLLIDERFASKFMEVLKDGKHLGLRSLAYVWQSPEGRGLPSAIAQVKQFVRDGKMIVACGDVLVENGISQPIQDFLKQENGARMITTHISDSAGYSPLEITDDLVVRINSKDKNRHQPGFIDLGFYMYYPEVFSKIDTLVPSPRGETEIWELNQIYANQGTLRFTNINGWWADTGESIESYLRAHQMYENKGL